MNGGSQMKKIFSIGVELETVKKIDELAKKQKRSRNFIINEMIEKALEEG